MTGRAHRAKRHASDDYLVGRIRVAPTSVLLPMSGRSPVNGPTLALRPVHVAALPCTRAGVRQPLTVVTI